MRRLLEEDAFIANSYLPDDGNRPLHIAVKERNTEMVRTLLEYGARQTEANLAGETPVSLAQSEGDETVLQLLNV